MLLIIMIKSMHHFIILLDGNTKQELYRQEVPGTYRQDVQKCLSKCQDFWLGVVLA